VCSFILFNYFFSATTCLVWWNKVVYNVPASERGIIFFTESVWMTAWTAVTFPLLRCKLQFVFFSDVGVSCGRQRRGGADAGCGMREREAGGLRGSAVNPLIPTLKPQSNGPLYRNTVIGTLAVDVWAVTFGTAKRGFGGMGPRPVPSSLYQI